jgi:hypothetical protein
MNIRVQACFGNGYTVSTFMKVKGIARNQRGWFSTALQQRTWDRYDGTQLETGVV